MATCPDSERCALFGLVWRQGLEVCHLIWSSGTLIRATGYEADIKVQTIHLSNSHFPLTSFSSSCSPTSSTYTLYFPCHNNARLSVAGAREFIS